MLKELKEIERRKIKAARMIFAEKIVESIEENRHLLHPEDKGFQFTAAQFAKQDFGMIAETAHTSAEKASNVILEKLLSEMNENNNET